MLRFAHVYRDEALSTLACYKAAAALHAAQASGTKAGYADRKRALRLATKRAAVCWNRARRATKKYLRCED